MLTEGRFNWLFVFCFCFLFCLVHAVLEQEIQIGMRLLGAKSIEDLKPSMLELMPGLIGQDL